MWHIYTMESYLVIKKMNYCHLQRFGWILKNHAMWNKSAFATNPVQHLLPSSWHSSDCILWDHHSPKSASEEPVQATFMNLKTTLFEAERHHCKSSALAISGFSHYKVCIQKPRVALQYPNSVRNGGMSKGEGAR